MADFAFYMCLCTKSTNYSHSSCYPQLNWILHFTNWGILAISELISIELLDLREVDFEVDVAYASQLLSLNCGIESSNLFY